MLKKNLIIFVVAIAIVVFLYNSFSNQDYKKLSKELKASHIIHNSNKTLPSFSLVDQDNKVFNNNNLQGTWTLLLFIYTNCPDICSTELFDMATLKQLMLENQLDDIPKIVAVTFDPLRDTPEVLKKYIRHFDKDFIGVSGDQSEIDKLISAFGAYYERVIYDEKGEAIVLRRNEKLPSSALKDGYIINHTAWIYLIDPKGEIVAGFPTPHKPSKMIKDITLITKHFKSFF